MLFVVNKDVKSCTNIIVTKGASTDGSAFLVYTNDGEWLFKPAIKAAADHKLGDSIVFGGKNGGKIAQIAHTYAVIGFQMNEHQLAIGETTFTGRLELWNHSKFLKYWHFMSLVLDRAKTAREGVEVLTSLAEEYGYGSEGESFSIVDPNEAWLVEMVGTGEKGEGAIWVAQKVPDGMICAHANMSRIGEFPLDDPENCLYSENVISFAIEKGYYDPNSGKPFKFNDVYCPATPEKLRYCEARIWSIYNRAAPSLNLSSDYFCAVPNAERYPLFIKPDKKIDLKSFISLIRDHYEGTPFDMTKGIAAGPFNSPFRVRPLTWEVDSVKYAWGRSVSSPNTAFVFIGQMRSWLPNNIGGIVWFGEDDAFFSSFVPIYCCNTIIPKPIATGDINQFDHESLWWASNFVSNYCNLRYCDMIIDVQKVQNSLEDSLINQQNKIESEALKLKGEKRIAFLNNYSETSAKEIHQAWKDLGILLITKYNDGYVKDSNNRVTTKGYPKEWLEKVSQNDGEKHKIGGKISAEPHPF